MPYYISEYVGAGTKANPFQPAGSDDPTWTAIDLRPDASAITGRCFLWRATTSADARLQIISDDKLETLTTQRRNRIANLLGVSFSATRFDQIIAQIMQSPPVNGWKPLQPTYTKWEVWLGGLLWEAPRASGGASDNFNRANETPLASPWALAQGTMPNLTSNQVAAAAGTDTLVYYTGSVATANQYSAITTPSGFDDTGPAVRVSNSADDGYFYSIAGLDYYKIDGGSTSLLSTTGDSTYGAGALVRIEAEGSTIRAFHDGTPTTTPASITDTSITAAGDGAGFFIFADNVDNWQGGDLVDPVSGQPRSQYLDFDYSRS